MSFIQLDVLAVIVNDAANFPTDRPVASLDLTMLVDAIMYGTNDEDDAGLMASPGETTRYNDTTSASISCLPDGGENTFR